MSNHNQNSPLNTFESFLLYNAIGPGHYGAPEGYEFFQSSAECFKKGLIANIYIKKPMHELDEEILVATFKKDKSVTLSKHLADEWKTIAKQFIEDINKFAEQNGLDRIAALVGVDHTKPLVEYLTDQCHIIPIVFNRFKKGFNEPALENRWETFFNENSNNPNLPPSYYEQYLNAQCYAWAAAQLSPSKRTMKDNYASNGLFANEKTVTTTNIGTETKAAKQTPAAPLSYSKK